MRDALIAELRARGVWHARLPVEVQEMIDDMRFVPVAQMVADLEADLIAQERGPWSWLDGVTFVNQCAHYGDN